MMDIGSKPYAEWLEEGVEHIFGRDPASICLMAILPSGEVLSGYYNADYFDKARYQACVQQDMIMDTLRYNAEEVREILDGAGEDD